MSPIDSFSSKPSYGHGHLAAIVESSTDAIVSKDLHGIVRSWNKAAQRIFGWQDHEIVGQSVRMLIPSDRQQEENDILSRVRVGEIVPKFETVRQHKKGYQIPVAVTVSPIRGIDGSIIGASKIAHHIGDELKTRQELEQSEARFRALADNIPQLAWMADSEGWIFWYNRRWHDYTGASLDDMEGWGWQSVHHPDHVDRVVERIRHSFTTGKEWEDTFPLRGADGAYRWFLSRAKPIFDANGEVTLWFGTNTDISQQREHEEHIDLLMGEMNHRSKNLLAIVQAMLHRTSGSINPEFVTSFDRRIAALAANQDMLVRRGWTGVPVDEIARSQLATQSDLFGDRIHFTGDKELILRPAAAEALGLALHELCTNATKYGALSNATGKVSFGWRVVGDADQSRLRVEWCEDGGPPVVAPVREGFGTMLLTRNIRQAWHADVGLDYRPDGLVWTAEAPLSSVEFVTSAIEPNEN